MFRGADTGPSHIGKWHLGYGPGSKPLDQGFDQSFGHMGGCIDSFSHFMYWNGPNRHDLWENNHRVRRPGQYFPDLMVEQADAFIREHRNRPFFIYFALNAPHYPYQGDPEWLARYENLPVPPRPVRGVPLDNRRPHRKAAGDSRRVAAPARHDRDLPI